MKFSLWDEYRKAGYLRVSEVAEQLKVSDDTIYRWVKAGHFPAPVQLGYSSVLFFPVEVVNEWLTTKQFFKPHMAMKNGVQIGGK